MNDGLKFILALMGGVAFCAVVIMSIALAFFISAKG